MVDNNQGKSCSKIEAYWHLIWECKEAKKIWQAFNELIISIEKQETKVEEYENVFKIRNIAAVNKLKN
jgi:hypothetical protein